MFCKHVNMDNNCKNQCLVFRLYILSCQKILFAKTIFYRWPFVQSWKQLVEACNMGTILTRKYCQSIDCTMTLYETCHCSLVHISDIHCSQVIAVTVPSLLLYLVLLWPVLRDHVLLAQCSLHAQHRKVQWGKHFTLYTSQDSRKLVSLKGCLALLASFSPLLCKMSFRGNVRASWGFKRRFCLFAQGLSVKCTI